jgi:hypothetical protein
MHGIRIWHLAALALSVPFLTAAVPSGCTGGLNPSFRQAIGQDAGTGIAPPSGFHVVGIFDQTGWPGNLTVTVVDSAFTHNWSLGFAPLSPDANVWECDLTEITPTGGTLWVPDANGVPQQVGITYDGIPLLFGQQLECGTLIKLRVVPLTIVGNVYSIWPPGTTDQTVQGLEFHVFVDIISH